MNEKNLIKKKKKQTVITLIGRNVLVYTKKSLLVNTFLKKVSVKPTHHVHFDDENVVQVCVVTFQFNSNKCLFIFFSMWNFFSSVLKLCIFRDFLNSDSSRRLFNIIFIKQFIWSKKKINQFVQILWFYFHFGNCSLYHF